ncbi:MAG: ABC transporter ATP-binding protein [Geobacter sp.]|nr:ABC transporter ATP-binding protein [Geobacter sp.]
MTTPTPVIKTHNLSKRFGELEAVSNLNITVSSGELFGLVGSDGAGKTTTMRMLASVMDPSEGEAWVLGRHTVRDAEAIKEDIGYMSQRFGLYPDLTVMENINFYADIYGISKKERGEKIEQLLAFSRLAPFRRRRAGNLSGGMKQKLGLACALVHTPKVLFLDEPTCGVDPVSRRDFWRILYQLLREGTTIFVTTAYLDEAERCGRVGLIHKGRLLACDTPQGLKKLMAGAILEVSTPHPRCAGAMLRERLEVESVGLFGDRLHVVTMDSGQSRSAIEQLFRQEGIHLQGIRAIEPNLEDVFVSVLGGEDSNLKATL